MTDDQTTSGPDDTDSDGTLEAGTVTDQRETAPASETDPDEDGPIDESPGQTSDREVTYDPTEAPLADLAASIGERETASSTDADTGSETEADRLFDQHSVSELDSDRLWDRLEEGTSTETPLLEDDRDEREIDAHRYCKQCEHFSAPPDVGCGLEGTEILELTKLGTFRVVDCPVVLEDEALEREY